MTTVWARQDIEAPASILWALLTDVERWPEWGPTVIGAELDGDRFGLGATGTVTTPVRLRLPFEVTEYEEASRWSWSVAGMQATDHEVVATGPTSCRVGFGVPRLARPYLAVCRMALKRLDAIAPSEHRAGS